MSTRWDETWHRLLEWTNDQGPSERLAAQILLNEGFTGFDPSHPLGGQDRGKDAVCKKDKKNWVMGVYFPRGQQTFKDIERKFLADLKGARNNQAEGFVFVTNQELRLAERQTFSSAWPGNVELYHLERVTSILDSPPMAAVRKQFLGIDYDEGNKVGLGGQGGMAPGAGGGGGGVIGSGIGGPGGPGGKITFVGAAGQAPGAGGGGGGVVGDNATAGGGGGGGDQVQVTIEPEELHKLRADGFDHVEFQVGRGGTSDGAGEDTIVNFVKADGTVLKSMIAKGGKEGLPGTPHPSGRQVAAKDIEDGLHVSSLLLTECAHIRNGLLYLLGAGWEQFEFPRLPFEAQWPLVCVVSTGKIESETLLQFSVVVTDPKGFQVLQESFSLSTGNPRNVARPYAMIPIRFTSSQTGVWSITITSGGRTLAQLPIDISVRTKEG
ncbi:MAG TPA: hypothetical protein VNZ47_14190 [Candidatus Dormibacteraeota bacterium]|nr:hypothetical protein [Candidatus Dormibacteraeota bacterium]